MIEIVERRDGRSVAIVITKRSEVEYPSYRICEGPSNHSGFIPEGSLLYPLGVVSKFPHAKRKSYPWGHTGSLDLHFRTRTEAIESLLRIRKVIS